MYDTHHDHVRNRLARGTPVVRDVCRHCNNITLCALDGYMAEVNREYLSVPPPTDGVLFRYDYHRLLRYLLKVWYNSARAGGLAVAEHARFAPYILGQEREPPLPTTLLLGLLGDFELSSGGGKPSPRYAPRNLRLEESALVDAKWKERIVLGRQAGFNAYTFVAHFWKPGVPRARRREFVRGLAGDWNLAVLSPTQTAVHVPISRIDPFASALAWFSGKSAAWSVRRRHQRRTPQR